MRVGVHVSIAGGIHKAVERAEKLGCETFQVFLCNPRAWRMTPLDPRQVELFRTARKRANLGPVVVHMPYLANLSASDSGILNKAVESLKENLDRCDLIGAEYLVTHMGKGIGAKSRDRMVGAIIRAWSDQERSVSLLLENTAGQGSEIGFQLEELAEVFDRIPFKNNLGICIDTCHAFAAGYSVHHKTGLSRFLRDIEQLIGIQYLKALHLNDSLRGLGSHIDRHAHIGKGELGLDGFRRIVNHPKLRNLPGILETPKKTDKDDSNNLAAIRALMQRKSSGQKTT